MTEAYRVTGGPWPERIGLVARIVEAPLSRSVYPWAGKGDDEVVVFIDDDPFRRTVTHPEWSCVMRRRDLTLRDTDG